MTVRPATDSRLTPATSTPPLKSRRSVASQVFHGPVRDVATVKIDRWKRPISNAGAPPLTARNRRQHVKKADRTQQI